MVSVHGYTVRNSGARGHETIELTSAILVGSDSFADLTLMKPKASPITGTIVT